MIDHVENCMYGEEEHGGQRIALSAVHYYHVDPISFLFLNNFVLG